MYHCYWRYGRTYTQIWHDLDGSKENNNLGGSGSYGGNNRGGHWVVERKFLKKLN